MFAHFPVKNDKTRSERAEQFLNMHLQQIFAKYVAALDHGIENPIVVVCDVTSAGGRDAVASVFGTEHGNRVEAECAGMDGGSKPSLHAFIAVAPADLVQSRIDQPESVDNLWDRIPGLASALVYVDWWPIGFQTRYDWDAE